MAVIAVYSPKGGVGKTTVATSLAWCAASVSRRRTLLWDLDPQGGAAFLLGLDDPANIRASDVATGTRKAARAVVETGIDRLALLPADYSLRQLETRFSALGKKKRLARVAAVLERDYERVVLDCPPVLNDTSLQIIRAADIIVAPMPPSPLSTRALAMIRDEVTAAGGRHPPILPLLSMVDMRRTVHREARAENPKWPVVPMASAIEQMAVRRQPLGEFADRSPPGQALRRVWTAIERRLAQA